VNPPNLISRGSFLRTSALSAALMLRPRCLLAAPARREGLSFIVVTDTHLGYKDEDKAERGWQQMAAEIDEAPGSFVLHLGDVVDGGREAQYANYLASRRLIRKPVHEVPGNHDPQRLFARHIREEVDAAFEYGWLRVVLINNSHPSSHEGFIAAPQIAWLEEQCQIAESKDQLLLFGMHVPVHHNQHPDRGWHVKPANGQTAFYSLMQRHADRTLALFHGHLHNGLRGWDDHAPVHEVCFPSALYNHDRKLEQQNAPGYNPPEFRPGFTRVEIRADAMVLQFQPLGFPEVRTKELPRGKA
jgi:predicted phosphodiesterase